MDTHNPYTAQVGCFQCGGQASQPDTGSTTCICNGAGRDYQVSALDKDIHSYLYVKGEFVITWLIFICLK